MVKNVSRKGLTEQKVEQVKQPDMLPHQVTTQPKTLHHFTPNSEVLVSLKA